MEGDQTSGETLGDFGFVVPPLVDAHSGDKHMPKRFVNSLFDAVAFVCHVLTPFGRGSENGFGKSQERSTHCRFSPLYVDRTETEAMIDATAKALEAKAKNKSPMRWYATAHM